MRMDFASRIPEIAERTIAIQSELDLALTSVRKVVSHINPVPLKGPVFTKPNPRAD
jgi:hypothetical protein